LKSVFNQNQNSTLLKILILLGVTTGRRDLINTSGVIILILILIEN